LVPLANDIDRLKSKAHHAVAEAAAAARLWEQRTDRLSNSTKSLHCCICRSKQKRLLFQRG
jgi:hypothetical protein